LVGPEVPRHTTPLRVPRAGDEGVAVAEERAEQVAELVGVLDVGVVAVELTLGAYGEVAEVDAEVVGKLEVEPSGREQRRSVGPADLLPAELALARAGRSFEGGDEPLGGDGRRRGGGEVADVEPVVGGDQRLPRRGGVAQRHLLSCTGAPR